jgi:hypothetical protein
MNAKHEIIVIASGTKSKKAAEINSTTIDINMTPGFGFETEQAVLFSLPHRTN